MCGKCVCINELKLQTFKHINLHSIIEKSCEAIPAPDNSMISPLEGETVIHDAMLTITCTPGYTAVPVGATTTTCKMGSFETDISGTKCGELRRFVQYLIMYT